MDLLERGRRDGILLNLADGAVSGEVDVEVGVLLTMSEVLGLGRNWRIMAILR